jgi:NhaA family Na+:H+ antiporter
MDAAALGNGVSLGIAAGLFIGKQIGVLAAVFLARKAKVGALPAGASWRHIYGVAALCGIGFTMSLFIGSLAFADPENQAVLGLQCWSDRCYRRSPAR